MISQSDQCHRRSIRLSGYDYSQPGAYFLTLCTQDRACLFGEIVDDEMWANDMGLIVAECWLDISNHFPNAELDKYVIMPNHIHGIVNIIRARHAVPQPMPPYEQFGRPVSGSIPTLVRSFKSAVTNSINKLRKSPRQTIWQRNYWEHIVRDEIELHHLLEYIRDNPIKWTLDKLYRTDVGARHAVPVRNIGRK
jgi:putative transposase